jgi:AmmeMemoRadiSam system protein A
MSSLTELGPTLPALARRVLEQYLSTGSIPKVEGKGQPPAPVFVTLHDREDHLRGCIGTLSAQQTNVFEETAHNAISAATRDPRFDAVTRDELDDCHIDVTVLHPVEPVQSESELDPRRYGVVVRDAVGRQGVLLPDLPGIDDVATQIAIARQKAFIKPGAPILLFRFLAERFEETLPAK